MRCLTLCCLLAFAATAQQRPKEWNHTCNVRDYGARGVREERATQAIQAAIDACAAAGGGRVVLPPGAYTSGALLLKDNIDLHVEAGAVLFSSRADEDFPEGRRALVNSDGASRIALTGRGVIDGQSRYEYGGVLVPAHVDTGLPGSKMWGGREYGSASPCRAARIS